MKTETTGQITLLERAKALLTSRTSAKAAALAIVPLAAAVANAQPVTLNLSGANGGVEYAGTYSTSLFNLTESPLTNGVRVQGTFGPVFGDPNAVDPNGNSIAYIDGFNIIDLFGGILGPLQFGSQVVLSYDVTFSMTGGEVSFSNEAVSAGSGSQFLGNGNFINPPILLTGTGSVVRSIATIEAFDGSTGDGDWNARISFSWNNSMPTDSLTLTFNRVDVSVVNSTNFGACCIGSSPTGGLCEIVSQATCGQAGTIYANGVYGGDNSTCVTPGQPARCCLADFNGSGDISVQDIFDFMTAWFSNNPNADVNGQGGISVQDIFDFLARWFRGCFF